MDISGANGADVFAVATVNLGIATSTTVSADVGGAAVPIDITLCQTNPVSGRCTSPIGIAGTTSVAANATPTFGIFVRGSGAVPFNPASSRIFVRFKDAEGLARRNKQA